VKQEQSMLRREAARFCKNLDGIRLMSTKLPAAMFVVDIKREHNAVAEATRLKIPIVAITDTNCDPSGVEYPIAGNDDAIRSVRLLLSIAAEAISRGRAEYEAKYARRKTADEPEAAAAAPVEAAAPAVAATATAEPVTVAAVATETVETPVADAPATV
jgi:small subunit ribosomal protein S2